MRFEPLEPAQELVEQVEELVEPLDLRPVQEMAVSIDLGQERRVFVRQELKPESGLPAAVHQREVAKVQ